MSLSNEMEKDFLRFQNVTMKESGFYDRDRNYQITLQSKSLQCLVSDCGKIMNLKIVNFTEQNMLTCESLSLICKDIVSGKIGIVRL